MVEMLDTGQESVQSVRCTSFSDNSEVAQVSRLHHALKGSWSISPSCVLPLSASCTNERSPTLIGTCSRLTKRPPGE